MAWRDAVTTGGRIRLKHSKTSGETLGADGLENGEIALQAAEGLLYYKDADGNIQDAAIAGAPADGNTYGRKDGAWVDLASAAALQFRQGTDAERLAMDPVPASGEPIYTTDTNRFFIGDGTTTGGRGIVTDSDAYVICQPGDDLLAKYTAAKALLPGGNAKSATNRAALIIYPGAYSLGTSVLDIDTDFVDVIGLGSAPLSASVYISGDTGNNPSPYAIVYGADDVRVIGLFSTNSYAAAGGAQRYVQNCGSTDFFYRTDYTTPPAGEANVVGGILNGCYTVTSGIFGSFCGSQVFAGFDVPVFNGRIENCTSASSFFLNTIAQGVLSNSLSNTDTSTVESLAGVMQLRAEFCSFPSHAVADKIAESASGAFTITLLGGIDSTCTISNASPAVVTLNNHQLPTGTRVQFTTDGALPTGLSVGTTYYVKRIDANTFQLSLTLNGASRNTSSAGSGTHTLVAPPGKDGGWYSYCTFSDGEYTTT